MIPADLRSRVAARLADLTINPFEAARRVGLERSFINDILIGRKKTVREAGLKQVAQALECDVEYLTGHQDIPRRRLGGDPMQGIPIGGICETGVFRSALIRPSVPATAAIMPDPRFPGMATTAWIVRGNGADEAGVFDGDYAVTLDFGEWTTKNGDLRDGLLCVVRRRRDQFDETEISLRRVEVGSGSIDLVAPSSEAYPSVALAAQAGERIDVLGVLSSSVRLYL